MNKLTIAKIFLLNILIIILFSCEDVVQVKLENEDIDLISVEAYISTLSKNNIFVKLEKSSPVDETEKNEPVTNAIITISDDLEVPTTVTLRETEVAGKYMLPDDVSYSPVPGRTYHLHITTAEGVEISGSDYMQEVEPLDSVTVHLSARGGYEFLAVFINGPNYPGPIQYYKWDIYVNRKFLYESNNMIFVNDELVDGNYVYNFEIFTDFFINEDERVLHIGDTVFVEQMSISEAAYDFYLGMMNQTFSGSPFSVPPANIPGNLTASNGKKVLGFFSARDISLSNQVVIDSSNFTPVKPIAGF